MATEYINAKQVYERYGIARSMLGRLVESGRVTRKSIDDGVMVLNLYKVADIEAVVEGASSNG